MRDDVHGLYSPSWLLIGRMEKKRKLDHFIQIGKMDRVRQFGMTPLPLSLTSRSDGDLDHVQVAVLYHSGNVVHWNG